MRWRSLLFVPILVSISWVSSWVSSEAAVLDIAVALGALTVLAAIVDWRGGLAAAVTSALSLNFFHAEPRYSLAIESVDDVILVVILAAAGIAVSIAVRAYVRRELTVTRREEVRRDRDRLLEDLWTATPVMAVWGKVVDSSDEVLESLDVRILQESDGELPRVSRRVSLDGSDDSEPASWVTIPAAGAFAEFRDPRLQLKLVIQPHDRMKSVTVSRQLLSNFLDDLEVVIGSR